MPIKRSNQGHTALLTPALSSLGQNQDPWRRVAPRLIILAAILLLTAGWACAQPHYAPPPAAPIQTRSQAGPSPQSVVLASVGSTPYSIGEPTDAEQLYLELINRARANPLSEATRLQALTDPNILGAYSYFDVDLAQLIQDLGALPVSPPLSFHPGLIQAARLHSQDMLANAFQGHTGSDGKSPGQRITAQSYSWSTYGENVYSYSESVEHGHAGFEVDWGPGPAGMQSPPGHRLNIHSAGFREVGIGVVLGVNGTVGPQLVTQDFGSRFGATPLITGVAYYDLNANGFYDMGEGLSGIRVDVEGSNYYASTANSGGYAVPVPGNGTYNVSFSAPGLNTFTVNTTVTGSKNIKVDFVPVYSPPQLHGPSVAGVGQNNAYTFDLVGASAGYEWSQSALLPYTATLGAESGLAGLSATVSSGYNVVDTGIKATGTASYHLAHPNAVNQVLQLTNALRPSPSSQLIFASRLGWASSTQIARAELSLDDGATWQILWSRAGTGTSGQSNFETVTRSLADFADQSVLIRFAYVFSGGTYYVGGGSSLGWYLDDIRVTNAEQIGVPAVAAVTSPPGVGFTPQATGTYLLAVRAQVGQRWLAWGPALEVSAQAGAPVFEIQGRPTFVGNRVEFDVRMLSGQAGALFVQTASSPRGPWATDNTATFQTLQAGVSWRASSAQGGNPMFFYRVRSQ